MVTQAQVQQAHATILQLQQELEDLRKLVQFVIDSQIAGVALDTTVINGLVTQYSTLKAALVTTFNTLP